MPHDLPKFRKTSLAAAVAMAFAAAPALAQDSQPAPSGDKSEVMIQPQGKAEATTESGSASAEQPAQGGGQAGGAEQGQMQQAEQQPQSIDEMTGEQLVGRTIMTGEGDKIGEIDELAVSQQDNQLYAVAKVGGVLGIGGQKVAVPISDLEMQQDQVVLTSGMNKDQLKQEARYSEDQYRPVEQTEMQVGQLKQQSPGGAAGEGGMQQQAMQEPSSEQQAMQSEGEQQTQQQAETGGSQSGQSAQGTQGSSTGQQATQGSSGQQLGLQKSEPVDQQQSARAGGSQPQS